MKITTWRFGSAFLLLIIFFSCGHLSIFRQKRPVIIKPPAEMEEIPVLPEIGIFSEIKIREKQKKKSKVHFKRLFQSQTDPNIAYKTLKEELKAAAERHVLGELFNWFVEAPAFQQNVKFSDSHLAFIEKWVRDAKRETDAEIKPLYSDFFFRVRHPGLRWRQFVMKSDKIRPGDSLILKAFSFRQNTGKLGQFKVVIEKMVSDKSGSKPVFQHWFRGKTLQRKRSIRFSRKMNSPGIFRISVSGKHFFQLFYCQVSGLDALVKSDGNKITIWGASRGSGYRPPYEVTLYFEDGQVVKTLTDSSGLCVLRIHRKNLERSLPFSGCIGLENHFAFFRGYTPVAVHAGLEPYLTLNTSSNIYSPEQRVHFSGIFKAIKASRKNLHHNFDSILVYAMAPGKEEIFRNTLPLDSFGFFHGAMDLDNYSVPGQYTLFAQPLPEGMHNQETTGSFLLGSSNFTVRNAEIKGPSLSIIAAGETQRLSDPPSFFLQSVNRSASVSGPVVVRWFCRGMRLKMEEGNGKFQRSFLPDGESVFIAEDTLHIPPTGQLAFKFSHPLQQPFQFLTALAGTFRDFSQGTTAIRRIKAVSAGVYPCIRIQPEVVRHNQAVLITILGVPLLPSGKVDKIKLTVSRYGDIVLNKQLALKMENGVYFVRTEFLPRDKAEYHIRVAMRLSTGRWVRDSTRFSVASGLQQGLSHAGILVETDKKHYTPGDTARLFLSTAMDAGCILMTHEQGGLNCRSKCYNSGRVEFSIPIPETADTDPWAAFYFPGGEGIQQKRIALAIKKKPNLPLISLDGPRNLKPGGIFRGTLEIRDPSGKPLKSAFSLSLTEHCISSPLNGQTPHETTGTNSSVRLPFNRLEDRVSTFQSSFGQNCLFLFCNFYAVPDLAVKRGCGLQDPLSEGTIFSSNSWEANTKAVDSFQGSQVISQEPVQTIPGFSGEENHCSNEFIWLDSLKTDTSGRIPVEFVMPESRHQWNLNVTGSSGEHIFSFDEYLVTSQKLEAILSLPSRMIQNDSCMAVANLVNYSTQPISGEAYLKTADAGSLKLSAAKKKPFHVGPMSGTILRWPFKALYPGNSLQILSVVTETVMISDSVLIRIKPIGRMQSVSRSGVIKAGNAPGKRYHRVDLNKPGNAQWNMPRLSISCYPSVLHSICHTVSHPNSAEQKNLADAMSEILALQALATVRSAPDSLKNLAPVKSEKIMRRLYLRQNLDGGWGWPEQGVSDPLQSALAVQIMQWCKTDSKTQWNNRIERQYRKALKFLINRLKGKITDDNEIALLTMVVCTGGQMKAVRSVINKLYRFRGRLSPPALALLLESLHLSSRNSHAEEILSIIEDRAFEISSEASWYGDLRSSWFSNPEEATAYVLQVLVNRYPRHRLIPKILNYLGRKKTMASWGTPKTTAAVVSALCSWLKNASGSSNPQYTGKIFLNGNKLHAFQVNGNNLKGYHPVFHVPTVLIKEKNRIVLGYEGKGDFYYSCGLTYFSEMSSPEGSGDISVESQYLGETRRPSPGATNKVLARFQPAKFRAGEKVTGVIHIKAFRDFKHIRLSAGIPAGFQFSGISDEADTLDSPFIISRPVSGNLDFHASLLKRGKYRVTYSMRATIPGRFRADGICLTSVNQEGILACSDPELIFVR